MIFKQTIKYFHKILKYQNLLYQQYIFNNKQLSHLNKTILKMNINREKFKALCLVATMSLSLLPKTNFAQEGSGNWTQGQTQPRKTEIFVPSYSTGNSGWDTRGFMMLPTIRTGSGTSTYNTQYDPGHRFYVLVKPGETVYWGFHKKSGSSITGTWYYDNRPHDGSETGSLGFYPNTKNSSNMVAIASGSIATSGTGVPTSESSARLGPNQVTGSGFTAHSFTNTTGQTRAFWLEITGESGFNIDWWNVTVVSPDGTPKPGRVYCKYWSIWNDLPTSPMGTLVNSGSSNLASHSNFGFYIPTLNNYSFQSSGNKDYYIKRINFGDCNGGYTVFYANENGPQNTGDFIENRKSRPGAFNNHHFPLFVGEPDPEFWPSSTLPVATTTVAFTRRPDGTGGQAEFSVTIDNPGVVDILVDIDNNGVHSEGDVVLSAEYETPGTYILFWDGNNDAGIPVPSGTTIQFKTSLLFYPVHFPIYDMEQSLGLEMLHIRPLPAGASSPITQVLYWDDSEIAALTTSPAGSQRSETINVTGSMSPAHIWWASGDNGFSQNRTINTWSGGFMMDYLNVFTFNWDASDVGIVKTVNKSNPIIGENVTFTLTVTAHGLMDPTGIIVKDTIPSGYEFVSYSTPSLGSVIVTDNVITWNIGDDLIYTPLPLHTTSLDITVKVLSSGEYLNTASVSSTSDDPNPTNDTSSATITPHFTISGNILHDANGLNDLTVNGPNYIANTGLIAVLINSSNTVIDYVYVDPLTGTFNFEDGYVAGNYSIVLTLALPTVGSTPPLSILPSQWLHTGENLGTDEGHDGIVDGILSNIEITNRNIENANFGIQKIPVAEDKHFIVPETAFINGDPGNDFPIIPNFKHIYMTSTFLTGYDTEGSLSGTDLEDCPTENSCNSGTGTTFTIESILPHTKVYYDFGGLVGVKEINPSLGINVIENFDATNLIIYGEAGAGTEGSTFGFIYSMTDNAGATSAPVSYKIETLSPLPIELMLFNAYKDANQVAIEWITATETNNAGFEIEKSIDGKKWNKIGYVKSNAINGNSNALLDYQFNDVTPNYGRNIYRLKQIDLNGNYKYSETRTVWFGKEDKISIYPNPATDFINISGLNGKETIKLYDVTGKTLQRFVNQHEMMQISIEKYNIGVYYIQIISNEGSVLTYKIVKK